jgi:hypothetical protein
VGGKGVLLVWELYGGEWIGGYWANAGAASAVAFRGRRVHGRCRVRRPSETARKEVWRRGACMEGAKAANQCSGGYRGEGGVHVWEALWAAEPVQQHEREKAVRTGSKEKAGPRDCNQQRVDGWCQ